MRHTIRYVYEDVDRHGNVRVYVKPPGARKKVRIRAAVGSPEFWQAYNEAMAGAAADAPAQAPESSLRWLVERYYGSSEFARLDARTRHVRRLLLDRFCAHRGGGTKPYRLLGPEHITARRDEITTAPEGANGVVKALRQVYRWAMLPNVKLATHNPAADVPYIATASEGFHTWTVAEVRRFEDRHPVGTKARLAMALLLYTGVRRSDAVLLGRQMVRDGWLHFVVTKGRGRKRKDLAVPVLPELRAVLDRSPVGELTFLVTEFGKPFSAAGFGNKFRQWCDEASLKHCSAHGLRKAGATIAAENGATEHQLMAIYGWDSPKQAAHYTRQASRKKMAGEAMRLIAPADLSHSGDGGFPTSAKTLKGNGK